MTNDARRALASTVARRYPLVGGAAAWYLPLVAAVLATGAAAFEAFEVAVVGAALGWAAHRLTRSFVLEFSNIGLARGFLATGALRARTTVIPWGAVVEVYTNWCRPGDDSALETAVRDREGGVIRLSTAMGLSAYWACLTEIVRRAPTAARTGLTDRALADGPPAAHHVVSALGTAAGLALVLAAFVTMHYLWAQGRSSFARDLSRIGAAGEFHAPACAGSEPARPRGAAAADHCP